MLWFSQERGKQLPQMSHIHASPRASSSKMPWCLQFGSRKCLILCMQRKDNLPCQSSPHKTVPGLRSSSPCQTVSIRPSPVAGFAACLFPQCTFIGVTLLQNATRCTWLHSLASCGSLGLRPRPSACSCVLDGTPGHMYPSPLSITTHSSAMGSDFAILPILGAARTGDRYTRRFKERAAAAAPNAMAQSRAGAHKGAGCSQAG